MTNILLSIDFSKHAQDVALCTAELAQQARARLILFHVYHPDAASDQETDNNSERCVQARLDKLARKLHKKTDVSITRLMKPVSVANEAFELAKIVKADVAVICDQASGPENRLLLTNCDGMPVITVSTAYPINTQALKQQLSEQLSSLGCSPVSLLEAI